MRPEGVENCAPKVIFGFLNLNIGLNKFVRTKMRLKEGTKTELQRDISHI